MTFLQRKLERIDGRLANIRARIQKNLATIAKLQNENCRLQDECCRLEHGRNHCNIVLAAKETKPDFDESLRGEAMPFF